MINKTITIIGGGHGCSNLLRAFKHYHGNLNIIISVTDSGGSTGKIRNAFNCPAMGDIRLCMTTLSNQKFKNIYEHRIEGYNDCVGNLIIASLIKIYGFKTAIEISQKLFGVKECHKIYPVSLDNYNLCGEYVDGKIVEKENNFNVIGKIKKTWLNPLPKPNKEATESIRNSDIIIISPGSFYTSILPVFLVPIISSSIHKKKVIWITNLIEQETETKGMNLTDYYKELSWHTHIDIIYINDSIPNNYLLKLNNISKTNVLTNIKDIKKIKIIKEDFLARDPEKIIHNYSKLYDYIMEELR